MWLYWQVPLTIAEVYEDMQSLQLEEEKEGAGNGGGIAQGHRGWRFGQIPTRARGGLQDPMSQKELRMTPKVLLAAERRAQQELECVPIPFLSPPICLTALGFHKISCTELSISKLPASDAYIEAWQRQPRSTHLVPYDTENMRRGRPHAQRP